MAPYTERPFDGPMASISQGVVAEAIGTFALVFVGAGAIVMGATMLTGPGDPFDHGDLLAIALAHGLTIFAMVNAFGHISGGQFNPAVSLALLVSKKQDATTTGVFVLAQLLGAAVGALLLRFVATGWGDTALADTHVGIPALAAAVSPLQGVVLEVVLTFFLAVVVLGTIDARSQARVGGLAIGMTVALDVLIGGPLTGAAMNPARWFGPALVDGFFANAWLYIVGPLAGGVLAGAIYGYFLEREPAALPRGG